ncbi:transposable element Tc1 transposase [Trichonephila clavipes]|uniref:Transposable element Tc1 transposase n=1 Tax=Trichonephila clavipes TaxID=2585209 RepID=A0A8X6R386_TRICX|nr:transposable element Tc1 transposase [Trichonephila clavipes]
MTGQRCIDEVLLPHVRLFRRAVGDKFVFMDDNATYLNPIENVWDALGRQVAGRNYPPTNKNTLIPALTEEWDKLPQQLLDNVVRSMIYLHGDNKEEIQKYIPKEIIPPEFGGDLVNYNGEDFLTKEVDKFLMDFEHDGDFLLIKLCLRYHPLSRDKTCN